jgi:putative endonuclease
MVSAVRDITDGQQGRISARAKGLAKEEAAARYLAGNGHTILDRNFRSRYGEIDIVTRQGEFLVFVEVRYRKRSSLVTAEESVTREKVRRLKLAVRRYLAERGLPDAGVPIRVDLCVVRDAGPPGAGSAFEIIPGIIEFT